jgi:hypothetical protein
MADLNRKDILEELRIFSLGTGGIGSWLTDSTCEEVFLRLSLIEQEPLSKVQLNQLLVLSHEAPVSDDFFRYYWLSTPKEHPYNVTKLPGF